MREEEEKSARIKAKLDQHYFANGHRQERPHPISAVETARHALAEMTCLENLNLANEEWARRNGYLPNAGRGGVRPARQDAVY
jgi:hypothetical protein